MLYIIGTGLNEKGIPLEGKEAIKKSKKIYLESYTVEFPYSLKSLEKSIGRKIIPLEREKVESNFLIKESKKENISLLVYGGPLFATTHISLIQDCKKNKIKYNIIYSSSIFDAIAETGLQLYKFGKILSMPQWQKNFTPDSFMDLVKENQTINAHSLILIDIGLKFSDSLEQLITASKSKNIKLDKIIICSRLGTKRGKIYYDSISKLKKNKINAPFCIIIPGKLHFLEEEFLKKL